MKKSRYLLCISIVLIVFVALCIKASQRSEPISDASADHDPPGTSEQDWITWLAHHWNADSATWIELATLNSNGDVEAWLSRSDVYGYSAKIWNHIEAACSVDPITIPTDCDDLENAAAREDLAETFSVQLMDELCQDNESWSFQITDYKIAEIVTEKASRDDAAQEIWICFFFADFKFDGVISPIAIGNTDDFVRAESFGMYELFLADGNCIFYPIYGDNLQRIFQ